HGQAQRYHRGAHSGAGPADRRRQFLTSTVVLRGRLIAAWHAASKSGWSLRDSLLDVLCELGPGPCRFLTRCGRHRNKVAEQLWVSWRDRRAQRASWVSSHASRLGNTAG